MLGPRGPDLFVGCKFTALGGGLGARNGLTLIRGQDDRSSYIGTCEPQHSARDVILVCRGQATHSFHGFVE